MPDIFGRERDDYAHIRAMTEQRGDTAWNAHQQACIALLRSETPGAPAFQPHDFNALGRGGGTAGITRAPEDATALGFITNTGLQILTMIDEIYYTADRLNQFVAINSEVAEGAQSYGVRVVDIVGEMDRVAAPGYDAPTATVSRTIAQAELHYYGVDFEYSLQDLRQAAFQGIPLQSEDMRAVMAVAIDEMEKVAFTGGKYGNTGLFNHAITGASAVKHVTADQTFEDMNPVEIRNLINGELSDVITRSKEVVGRTPRLMGGMTLYLPGKQYDLLTTRYIGDNAERTLMRSIKEQNVWTEFTGQPLEIVRVIELEGIGASSSDRMVVGLRNTNVAEMAVAIQPRLIRLLDMGRMVRGQVEARFGEVWVKRPNTMTYVDSV